MARTYVRDDIGRFAHGVSIIAAAHRNPGSETHLKAATRAKNGLIAAGFSQKKISDGVNRHLQRDEDTRVGAVNAALGGKKRGAVAITGSRMHH